MLLNYKKVKGLVLGQNQRVPLTYVMPCPYIVILLFKNETRFTSSVIKFYQNWLVIATRIDPIGNL